MGLLRTRQGYMLLEVTSAMQKAIRRGDGRLAGYWALELYDSGYQDYVWRRLYIISAEDCYGLITGEVDALHKAWELLQPQDKKRKDNRGAGRLFIVKAALLLAAARKCRDADHLICLFYERHPTEAEAIALQASIEDARKDPIPIPEYAFDCHTLQGRRAGKTKEDFFRDEVKALTPREPGLFDDLVK